MSLRRDDRGFVLITAMIVLAVFMMLTVAMVTIVDVQTNQTGNERAGEAAFNLADSALQAEAYQLQVVWPATSAQALPACDSSTPQEVGCEGAALVSELQTTTLGPDYARATWSAQVFDNTRATYAATLAATPLLAWDANGDGTLWVRAQATANGQTRTVVERVTRQLVTIGLPKKLVIAGGVYTSNDGNKIILQATDPSGVVGSIDVRCGTSATSPHYGKGNCLGWDSGQGQLSPPTAYSAGYTNPSGTSSTLTAAQLQELTTTASANGTLYDGTCPPAGTGGIVVVEGAVSCSYTDNTTTWNSQTKPGALIFLSGSVTLSGGTFYGILYMANQANVGGTPPNCDLSAPPLAAVQGTAHLYGAVYADGCGTVDAGDSATNLNFMLSAVTSLQSYQAPTQAPGTFRVVSN